jgi:glycerol kinase
LFNKKYIISIDQGTTSSRTILFDTEGRLIKQYQAQIQQTYTANNNVEQDLNDLWTNQLKTLKQCLNEVNHDEIACIGITNQRETFGFWDKKVQPYSNAISWQCRRSEDRLNKLGHLSESIAKITGLRLDAYFSAGKIAQLLEESPALRSKLHNDELIGGTVDTFLLAKLTAGRIHVTDPSNACRTMLYDINKLKWSQELLKEFAIPENFLPSVKPSNFEFGFTDEKIVGAEIPIHSLIGDQQAALYGHGCFKEGEAELTCGTGGFLLLNTGKRREDREGNLCSIAWQTSNEDPVYCLEAAILTMGSMFEYLKRLGLLDDRVISSIQSNDKIEESLFIMPTLMGFGSPYWEKHPKCSIIGLRASMEAQDIFKALIQGFACRVKQIVQKLPRISTLKIGGGIANNNYFCQFLADLLELKIERAANLECTAWGAARMAYEGMGFEIKVSDKLKNTTFQPNPNKKTFQYYDLWENELMRA